MSAPEHALLSASGAERWLKCTPSPRLEEHLPERTSEFAEEGRLAHTIAELKVRKQFLEPMGPRKFKNALKKLQENPLYQDEMLRHTDTYMDYISGIVHGFANSPYMVAEKRVSYADYAPEGFGTADFIILGGPVMHVIDFKYGKGVPVSAERNPQMMLYALGALMEYRLTYAIDSIKMAIVQPRLDSISEYELTANELIDWGVFTVRPAAKLAFAGEGDYAPGEHCRFCRAKATCRARCDSYTALEDFGGMKPPLISDEEVGDILHRAKTLKTWVAALEDYALKRILDGGDVPGWKAVEGRSNRAFVDTDKAFEAIKANGIDEALLYERKPITLTAVEALLGKAEFAKLVPEHIHRPPGAPALAPVNDKREAIKRTTATEDFGAPVPGATLIYDQALSTI